MLRDGPRPLLRQCWVDHEHGTCYDNMASAPLSCWRMAEFGAGVSWYFPAIITNDSLRTAGSLLLLAWLGNTVSLVADATRLRAYAGGVAGLWYDPAARESHRHPDHGWPVKLSYVLALHPLVGEGVDGTCQCKRAGVYLEPPCTSTSLIRLRKHQGNIVGRRVQVVCRSVGVDDKDSKNSTSSCCSAGVKCTVGSEGESVPRKCPDGKAVTSS